MKDIFFVGDFKNNNGPANVNKEIKKTLGTEKYCYSNSSGKLTRIVELVFKTISSRNICFCSFSKIDIIGIKICKILKKKTSYIMHGYIKKEQEINGERTKAIDDEKFILNNVNKIICVSELCSEYIKQEGYPASIYYIYNNIPSVIPQHKNIKQENLIMSTGGLIPLKNNLKICEAIKKINSSSKEQLIYVILGDSYNNKEQLKKYKFVRFYKCLPHDKCINLMQKTNLYIQNSKFETFGLSVIEALFEGCNILISKNVGAIGIFDNISSKSIIMDVDDINEIASKIQYILKHPNKNLIKKIDLKKMNQHEQLRQLVKIICS